MENLTVREKRIIKEIEEIRDIIYGYSEKDSEWQKEIRPHKLAIERDELIRDFIISHHLLTEEFINLKLVKYFIKYKKKSKRHEFFEQFVLQKLSYKEKLELNLQLNLVSKNSFIFLETLNSLRNKCAHRWFLQDKKIRLLYNGKDLLEIKYFKKFSEDVYGMHETLWEV